MFDYLSPFIDSLSLGWREPADTVVEEAERWCLKNE